MKESVFDAVILANGDYPKAQKPLEILNRSDFTVCCDGAANEFVAKGGIPSVIIGDCDSLSKETLALYPNILHKVSEQETNDLTKAVRYLYQRGKRRIAILGASGKREDHTLGNISLLIEYMRMGLEVRMFTDYGTFIPCRNSIALPCYIKQQVSIFSFGARDFQSCGLRYPLPDLSALWQGTLNETTLTEFSIAAQGDFLVFLNY